MCARRERSSAPATCSRAASGKAGNRIRITVQLIDAETGTHVWAERYDRAIEDIFAVQDEITLILATEMQVNLTEGEQARLRYSSTTNVEAWNLWVQGLAHFRTGVVTKDGVGKARVCWEKALALDPNSAALHAMIGFMHNADARFGWWDDRETAIAKSKAASRAGARARSGQRRRASLLRDAGQPRAPLRRFGRGGAAARSRLRPARSTLRPSAAAMLSDAGIHDEAIVQIEKAVRLSPKLPANFLGIQGLVYRLAGRTDDAIVAFKALFRAQPRLRPCGSRDHLSAGGTRSRRRARRSRSSARRGRTTRSRVSPPRSSARTSSGAGGGPRRAPSGGPAGVDMPLSPLWGEGLGEELERRARGR